LDCAVPYSMYLKAWSVAGRSCVHDQLKTTCIGTLDPVPVKKNNRNQGTPNGTIVQHDPKATDDAHERAAHVYQNVSVHMDSGSCPQGEVFWPNYHKKVLAVDHPVPARAHARQSPGRAGLQVYFGHTSFWRRNLYVKKLRWRRNYGRPQTRPLIVFSP
jgi:hypothetical protein